ncbi:Dabb family protein [Pandoraea communis]|uniref:Stress responsive alpha-beta barrel n=1 Tax=Pandoraea communis TaxID=2508297 RepID=A0A5E4RKA8_9BURK|nr:Dabb family protein [Pandoraea communis]MDM8358856.1 Dabb family protein [Pandoraea communis]VVD62459.1 stress responsive alpha-beta barrel [Pandoraea communis]
MNATPLTASQTAAPVECTLPPASERLAYRCAQIGERAFTARDYGATPIRHIVLLRFSNDVSIAAREPMIERFLRLKDECLRDGRPYIRSVEHGRQESGEGNGLGFEHAFLMTFESEGDRNFYVGEPIVRDATCFDPVHHAFKADIGPMLAPQGALVFDFFPACGDAPACPTRSG